MIEGSGFGLGLINPDPGGPKTYGSGFGFATLFRTQKKRRQERDRATSSIKPIICSPNSFIRLSNQILSKQEPGSIV
jgi:hypothetical protein